MYAYRHIIYIADIYISGKCPDKKTEMNRYMHIHKKADILRRAICAICAAAVFICGGATAFAEGEPSFDVEVNVPPKTVFLGDSIAAGYGLKGYDKNDLTKCPSYANILAEVFKSNLPEEADFAYENLAISGYTSQQLLDLLKGGTCNKALSDADAVVVSIGGNDMLGVFLGIMGKDNSVGDMVNRSLSLSDDLDTALAPFPEKLSAITDEIHDRTKNADCKLIIQTLYNPFEGHVISLLDKLGEEKIGKLNETIFSLSENGENYLVADVASSFKGRNQELTNIKDMDIHPNAEGHQLIAKTLEELIEKQTFTYHDDKAEAEYISEQKVKKAEEEKKSDRRKNIGIAAGAAAAVTACAAVGISIGVHKRKTKE